MMQPAKAIPEKLFFKIGEVCDLVGVEPHVLRYWESEFPMLAPQKNRAGQRIYRRRDVEIAMRIKELTREEGFTIAGAKKKLATELRGGAKLKIVTPEMAQESRQQTREPIAAAPPPDLTVQQQRLLRKLKRELQGLLTMLSSDDIITK
jgi:DNA-binding transcriptional MerR regulator